MERWWAVDVADFGTDKMLYGDLGFFRSPSIVIYDER